MADKGVPLVDDDLYAIEPAALIAAGQQADILGRGAGGGSHFVSAPVVRIAEARLGESAEPGLRSHFVCVYAFLTTGFFDMP